VAVMPLGEASLRLQFLLCGTVSNSASLGMADVSTRAPASPAACIGREGPFA